MSRDTSQIRPASIEYETAPGYPGWRAVTACFLMATFAWGIGFYAHGLYLTQLVLDHGWSTSAISAASTFYYLVGAGWVAVVSAAIARAGTRSTILTGVFCLALPLTALP